MQIRSCQKPSGGASVRVSVADAGALLADLEGRLLRNEGFAVATLNLDHVVKLQCDQRFHEAYLHHSHVTADGRPIVWLSRLSGEPVSLVAGSDLVDPVAELAARSGWPVAMVGSTAESLSLASSVLARRYTGFTAPLQVAPEFGFDPEGTEADAIIKRIAESRVRLCFVALGAPKQEVFVARAQRYLPEVGFLSVGAGLDFISGAQVRAPRIIRALAAEWLWRLALDPKRLGRRYAACAAILPGLVLNAARSRKDRRGIGT